MSDPRSDLRNYVLHVIRELGIAPHALAKRAGISPSTLSRFLKEGGTPFLLSNTTIHKIAKVSGVSPAFVESQTIADINIKDRMNKIYTRNAPFHNDEVTFIGVISIGTWVERNIVVSAKNRMPVKLLPSNRDVFSYFSCSMGDMSFSKYAVPHDTLLCVTRLAVIRDDKFNHGDIVIVERVSPDDKLSELSVRRLLRKGRGGYILVFESENQSYKGEIDIDDPNSYNREVRIIGKLEYVIRNQFG